MTPEDQAWIDASQRLRDKGITPDQVMNEFFNSQTHARPQEGGWMSSAHTAMQEPVSWYSVLKVIGIAIGVIGLLKLVGMAFDIDIPILHKSSTYGAITA